MGRSSKGRESVAVVLTLAPVTLVIATGLAIWIMGWLSNFGGIEGLYFYPDSYIDASAGRLLLHVKNRGSIAAVVYRVEIPGVDVADGLAFVETPLAAIMMTQSEVVVKPGEEGYIVARVNNILAGARYLVRVYTRAGSTYNLIVQAK
jgi:hypothetical protein